MDAGVAFGNEGGKISGLAASVSPATSSEANPKYVEPPIIC